MNWTAIIVFVLLFGSVTILGFAAAHWRRGDLDELHEWGLAGRRLGTIVIWFLLKDFCIESRYIGCRVKLDSI